MIGSGRLGKVYTYANERGGGRERERERTRAAEGGGGKWWCRGAQLGTGERKREWNGERRREREGGEEEGER